jgi:hypothetical protein
MPTVKRKDRPPAEPRQPGGGSHIAWGRHPFAPRTDADEVDGTVVGGYLIRRGPSGALVAVRERDDRDAD